MTDIPAHIRRLLTDEQAARYRAYLSAMSGEETRMMRRRAAARRRNMLSIARSPLFTVRSVARPTLRLAYSGK